MPTHGAPPAAHSRWRALLPTLLDLVIPTAGYFLLHWAGLPDIWALTIAGAATGVNALVNTIRRGRLDALGLLVVAEVAVSVALAAITADPRLILVRPAVYLAVAGVVNLVSCVAGRPLSYAAATPMATKGDPVRAVAYERAWHHSPELRAIHRQLTAGIGLAMLVYAVLRVLIVYSFSTGTAVLVQEVPGILLIALVVVLIRLRVPRLRRIVDAEQAALAAEPLTTNANLGTAAAEHHRHRADDDPGTAITDRVRNPRVRAATKPKQQHRHSRLA
jgi:intracellular septation protein A